MRSYLTRLACLAVVLGFVAMPARAIDPKYLPPNAEMAFTLNLKQILGSELLKDKKDLVDQAKATIKEAIANSPAKDLLEKASFDPFNDLHSITITSDGSKDPDALFIAVEGKFDPEKLVGLAKEVAAGNGEKIKVTKNGNVSIVEITPKDNEKTIYAGIINDSLIVAAPSREALNGTIARVTGNKVGAIKPALKSLLETTNAKQSLSFVATSAGMAKAAEAAPKQPGGDAMAVMQSIEGISLSVTVAKDIGLQAAGNFKDDESAKKLGMMANMGLTAGRGFLIQKAKEEPMLQPIVDVVNTVKLSTQGANIVIRAEVTAANLEKLLSAIPR